MNHVPQVKKSFVEWLGVLAAQEKQGADDAYSPVIGSHLVAPAVDAAALAGVGYGGYRGGARVGQQVGEQLGRASYDMPAPLNKHLAAEPYYRENSQHRNTLGSEIRDKSYGKILNPQDEWFGRGGVDTTSKTLLPEHAREFAVERALVQQHGEKGLENLRRDRHSGHFGNKGPAAPSLRKMMPGGGYDEGGSLRSMLQPNKLEQLKAVPGDFFGKVRSGLDAAGARGGRIGRVGGGVLGALGGPALMMLLSSYLKKPGQAAQAPAAWEAMPGTEYARRAQAPTKA